MHDNMKYVHVQIGLASILTSNELIEFYEWSLNERSEFRIFEICKKLYKNKIESAVHRVIICKVCITCTCT